MRTADFKTIQVKPHRKQRALVEVHQVTAGQVASEISAALHHLPLASLQRKDLDVGIVMTCGNRITREEHRLAPGQDLRPAMRDFAFVTGLGDRLRRSSLLRYAKQAAAKAVG